MPAPDNGSAPLQNNWEGYVQLATVGSSGLEKEKARFVSTVPEDGSACNWVQKPDWYLAAHAHYEFDFRLHSSSLGANYEPLSKYSTEWTCKDKTEEEQVFSSPYCMASSPARYRLCRGYQWKGTQKYKPQIAPEDIRADGFYSERHAVLPYRIKIDPQGAGIISYWLKSGFLPELFSKHRTFATWRLGHHFAWDRWVPWEGLDEPVFETDALTDFMGLFGFVMDSILFTYLGTWPYATMGLWDATHTGFGPISVSITLNHIGHDYKYTWVADPHQPLIPGREYFRGHRWIHVSWSWRVDKKIELPWGQIRDGVRTQLWINGERRKYPQSWDYSVVYSPPEDPILVVGGDPYTGIPLDGGHCRPNYPGDVTLDELYVYSANIKMIPCKCEDARGCKGGTGVPCFCSARKACKGGEKVRCPCWRSRIIRKCTGLRWWRLKNCRWKCTCGGDGFVPKRCIGSCRCENTAITQGCEEIAPGPCNCRSFRRCKGGWIWWCSRRCRCGRSGLIDKVRLLCKCNKTGKVEGELAPLYEPKLQWKAGRYYRQNDAIFTSREIDLLRVVERVAPEANRLPDPYGQPRWTGNEGLSQEQTREMLAWTWYGPAIKILGITWTAYTADIIDYAQLNTPLLDTQVELSLESQNGSGDWVHILGPFLNLDAGWAPVFVKLPQNYCSVRYHVRFNTRCDPINAILLETSILDDVTIYYMTRPQFLSWVESY
jgi:hypothetical protein